MCVCMCVYIYIYIYIHTHTYTHIPKQMHKDPALEEACASLRAGLESRGHQSTIASAVKQTLIRRVRQQFRQRKLGSVIDPWFSIMAYYRRGAQQYLFDSTPVAPYGRR